MYNHLRSIGFLRRVGNHRCTFYDHLNFSRASVVHFRASRYIMGLTYTPESKVMAVWIIRELHVEFQASRYIMRQNRRSEWNVMTIWISRELPLFIFKCLDISWASQIHLSQKLWLFESAESLRVQLRASRYIMHQNQRSKWKVMSIRISWELPWFVFERLEILWASHIHPSEKLCLFEFSESFCEQFRESRYMMSLNRWHPSESYDHLNF